jgi:succinate dehydrogenase/fumarate reductase flavoprotein subunit
MSLPSDVRRWDLEADLLVVGAGAAGMTAALVGALKGLKVVLCEKPDMVGGTTATSAGTVWIPGSHQSKAAGVSDTIESARTYVAASPATCFAARALPSWRERSVWTAARWPKLSRATTGLPKKH